MVQILWLKIEISIQKTNKMLTPGTILLSSIHRNSGPTGLNGCTHPPHIKKPIKKTLTKPKATQTNPLSNNSNMYGMVGGPQAQRLDSQHPKWTHNTVQHKRIAWKLPACENEIFPDGIQAMSHTEHTESCSPTRWKRAPGWGLIGEGWSVTYLSIQKICWRWGSDRCPFHTLPHAAWVWKEQEGRIGSLSSCTGRHTLTHTVRVHSHTETHQTYCG